MYMLSIKIVSHLSSDTLYAFVIFLFSRISGFLGSGPLWGLYIDVLKSCETSWWQNLLFIDNLANDTFHDKDYCMGWGWYLSNDMQMFLLAPIIAWLYIKSPKHGFFLAGLMLTGSLGLGFFYSYYLESYAGIEAFWKQSEPLWELYINPLVRMAPYLLGVILGLLYRNLKENGEFCTHIAKRVRSSLWLSYGIEVFGIALINLVIWLPAKVQDDNSLWPKWFHHAFMGSSKLFFTIGLALILLPGLVGSPTFVRKFLAARFWTPFATLVFLTYLLHLIMLLGRIFSSDASFFFDHQHVFSDLITNSVLSFAGAVILHLLVEAPIAKLEKIFQPPQDKTLKKETPEAKQIPIHSPDSDSRKNEQSIPIRENGPQKTDESKSFELPTFVA